MTVASEIKVPTSEHLGLNALYLIATMPEEERAKEQYKRPYQPLQSP